MFLLESDSLIAVLWAVFLGPGLGWLQGPGFCACRMPGQWLESPNPGPLFAKFSNRKFIVEERNHQPVLSEIALPEGWMAGCVFEIS